MADPNTLLIPIDSPVLTPQGFMTQVWWQYFLNVAHGLTTIDLTSQVTGILPPPNGGSGIANAAGETLTIVGGFALALTLAGATSVTLPSAGTLVSYREVQQASASTGVVAGLGTAVVTLTWPIAFLDTAYVATASVLDTTAAVASLSVVHIEAQSATQITVRVTNAAVGAITGTVWAIALHA